MIGYGLDVVEIPGLAGLAWQEEADLVRRAEEARADAILVDAFTEEEYHATAAGGGWGTD